jgi:hypothetical protein
MILCGIAAPIASLLEYRRLIDDMWSGPYPGLAGIDRKPHATPLYASTGVPIPIGVFAFFAVLLNAQ